MNRRNVKAIFFDAGYTLFYISPSTGEVIRQVYQELTGIGIDPKNGEKILLKHYRDREAFQHQKQDYIASPSKTEEFWFEIYERTVKDLGYHGDSKTLSPKMFSLFRQSKYYSVFPDVIEVLNILKAKRYRLGLISNYDASLWQTLEDLHLKDYFNPIVISVEAGFEKPHPGIFQLALKQVELKPEECVFVGDNPVSDAKGAAAIGMGSILIDRYHRYADDSEWTRVQNFKQLLEIL